MVQTAILFPAGAKQPECAAWLARAAQARRIAPMLMPSDAAILEAFALECEARARPPALAQTPIAA